MMAPLFLPPVPPVGLGDEDETGFRDGAGGELEGEGRLLELLADVTVLTGVGVISGSPVPRYSRQPDSTGVHEGNGAHGRWS